MASELSVKHCCENIPQNLKFNPHTKLKYSSKNIEIQATVCTHPEMSRFARRCVTSLDSTKHLNVPKLFNSNQSFQRKASPYKVKQFPGQSFCYFCWGHTSGSQYQSCLFYRCRPIGSVPQKVPLENLFCLADILVQFILIVIGGCFFAWISEDILSLISLTQQRQLLRHCCLPSRESCVPLASIIFSIVEL